MPQEQVKEAVRRLTRDRSSTHWVRANKQIYDLVREDLKVDVGRRIREEYENCRE